MSYASDGVTSVSKQTIESRDGAGVVTVEERIEGLRSTLEAMRPAFGPYRINPIDGTPWAELNIEYGGSTTPQEPAVVVTFGWRVTTSAAPIEEHPLYASDLEALSPADANQLKRFVSGSSDVEYVPVSGDLQLYIQKKLAGIDSYLRPQPILICTATYQRGSGFRPSVAAAGVVYQTATIRSALNIPFWDSPLSASLPNGEWLAEDIAYDSVSTGQRTLQQAFRYADQWDTDHYTHASGGVLINIL